jgi:hypothetical protein
MDEASHPTAEKPEPPPKWELLLIGGFVLLLVGVVGWGVFVSLQPPSDERRVTAMGAAAADYVGSASCATCHPTESGAHARSGHAQTLRRAAEIPLAKRLDGVTVADPEDPDTSWSYALREGKLYCERRGAGAAERLAIDYAFGSGHHATTFVTLTDRAPDHPEMLEHRMTAFAHKELPDITPGQGIRGYTKGITENGRQYASAETLKCFECHTTYTSSRGPLALDEATMVPNIGCERCHGPGRAHVEAAQRGESGAALKMPFGYGRSSVDEQLRMCGACHRLPEMGDPSQIRPDNPTLARFQPVAMMQSACYARSGKTISCVTCHDPHARTSTNQAGYEAACRSCHEGPAKTPCKVSSKSGCVACHMPRRDVSRGMMMTDHWIRSYPQAGKGGTPPATNPAARAQDVTRPGD